MRNRPRYPRLWTWETANRVLSLSRTTGYDFANRGRYLCTFLRLGNAYRVVTADLLKLLHIGVPEPANDADRLVCAISTSCAGMVPTRGRSGQRPCLAEGRGARGERGRLWTRPHAM